MYMLKDIKSLIMVPELTVVSVGVLSGGEARAME